MKIRRAFSTKVIVHSWVYSRKAHWLALRHARVSATNLRVEVTVAALRESPAAGPAAMRLLSGVNPSVFPQRTGLSKALIADVTRVTLLSRMSELVSLQRALESESLLTYVATERFVSRMRE